LLMPICAAAASVEEAISSTACVDVEQVHCIQVEQPQHAVLAHADLCMLDDRVRNSDE
jgi:hypothetical protein